MKIRKNSAEFVSYDYDQHSLCAGELVAKVNGNPYHFHYSWREKMEDPTHSGEVWCPPFWFSGGHIESDDGGPFWPEEGDWRLVIGEYNKKEYPQEILESLNLLIDMFNEHVPHGCCGGCI